jgi:hypothetical protein
MGEVARGGKMLPLVAAVMLVAVVAPVAKTAVRAPLVRAHQPHTEIGPEHPVSDPVYVDAAPWQSDAQVAFDGTNYLVVWMDYRGYELGADYADVYAARVTPDGTDLDPNGIPIAVTSAWEGAPAVAFDGTNYLVTWMNYPDDGIGATVFAARVTPAGTVLDSGGFPVSTNPPGNELNPSVAFDGTNSLIVWEDDRNGSHDMYGARVTPAGAVLDPDGIAISTASADETLPKLASDGTNYLVVWDAAPGSYPSIHGARVAPDGTVLDPSGIAISPVTQNWETTPSVASDGTTFMVAWADGEPQGAAYGTRVSSDGVVLDPSGISISTGGAPARSASTERTTSCRGSPASTTHTREISMRPA